MLLSSNELANELDSGLMTTPSGITPGGVVVLESGVATQLKEALQGQLALTYTSKGKLSTHQVLAMLLQLAGNANVFITSYTLSETAARALLKMKKNGTIKRLSVVIDHRIATYNPRAYQLLKQHANALKLTPCHAKVLVVQGETVTYSLITTANMSKNKRIECGYITTDKAIAAHHIDWITKVLTTPAK